MKKKKKFEKQSLYSPSINNEKDRPKMLALAIAYARQQRELSQAELARKAGMKPQSVGKYERGEDIPPPVVIVNLAKVLGGSPRKWLLYAHVQKAAKDPVEDTQYTMSILKSMIANVEYQEERTITPIGPTECITLAQFPQAFSPLCVVVGDRREEKPKNLGDLFAFSASCVDDRWLTTLRLPPDTEKITDKVFLYQEPEAQEWRRRTFGKKHLLVIGSPAANIFARELNRSFIHRFAVPSEAEEQWKRIKKEKFPDLRSPASLEHFKESNRQFMRSLMRKFQQPGFITYDPQAKQNENAVRVVASIITEPQQDFATLTIGRNPYAEKGERFFSILAAGVHHPGTAWAVKFLGDPKRFETHPFGGILEIHFPSKEYDPDKIKWYESVGLGTALWHTVGQSDLGYDPESLRNTILRCLNAKIITDVPVDKVELEDHLGLIDLIAGHMATKAN